MGWRAGKKSDDTPMPPPYIQRDIMDLWFDSVIGYKTCSHDHSWKHVSALHFFFNKEYAQLEVPFIIDSSSIRQALEHQ